MSALSWIPKGGAAVLFAGCLVCPAFGDVPLQVRSQVLEIEYEVDESALPLESAQLWYTLDQGQSWQLYGSDDDRQSPIMFNATVEGNYGFYFVLRNTVGASSAGPTPGTQPQLQAFVDYTPPVVQLHDLRQTSVLGQRIVQLRWTAIDTNLTSRPVEILYQRPPDETWYPVASEPLANTGRYDWRLPEDSHGTIAVRLTVADLGGHRVDSERKVIEIASLAAPKGLLSNDVQTGGRIPSALPRGAAVPSKEVRRLAADAYAEGMKLGEVGQLRAGIARLREAVRLNPQLADAFAEMGVMLYRLGNYDRSLSAYSIALQQQPTMRRALQGQARVHRIRNEYTAAAKSLRTFLRYNPNDAEIWMNLGDIGIYEGDEILARECYLRATEIDPSAREVIEQARKRLALMAEVSRTYRRDG